MGRLRIVFLFLVSLALQSCVIDQRDSYRDRDLAYCGGGHRLQVVDLNMSPDPVAQGQRVNRWAVRLRADGSGECRTVVRIRDADGEEVGRELTYRLRPGMNLIEVEPHERYRFSRNEHCFDVLVNIEGTARRVDAARRFCARETAGRRWTMRS
jgi:hypothetical protein